MKVSTVCHSQQSDQGLYFLPLQVSTESTLFVILSSLIWVYTVCHSQQSDQSLHYLPFSAVWSRSSSSLTFSVTVWAVWSGLHYLPFLVLSESTPFAMLSSLIKVYTVILNNLITVYTFSQQSDQGEGPLSFSWTVWSGSTRFDILRSLIRFFTVCHSQQSDQGLHDLSFSVWLMSTLFEILSKQYYQGLYCLPFSAVWSGSILFAIISLNRVYTVCHSQQSDLGLHCLPFSVWTESTLFAILSSLIRVYTFCHS